MRLSFSLSMCGVWAVFVILSLMNSFAFRRGFHTLLQTRSIITVPFNYQQYAVAIDTADMTKSRTYNVIKDTVKKSISRPVNASFFKTGPGEYAEHDKFLGVTNPDVRKIAKDYKDQVSLTEIQWFLESPFNEERFLALVLLIDKYEAADKVANAKGKKKTESTYTCEQLYQFYMSNLKYVNNWNLVDLSAHLIMGPYLTDKDRSVLMTLAQSEDLWERRVAILTTLHFIRLSDFEWTVKLAKVLLHDDQDLIHKAVGWMLREAGKKDIRVLRGFLDEHAHEMPRVMLRYSIEKLGAAERTKYLKMEAPDTSG